MAKARLNDTGGVEINGRGGFDSVHSAHVTHDREMTARRNRDLYCGAYCTLDGALARIIGGYDGGFAVIGRRDGVGGTIEYSWAAVGRVMAAGKAFKS